MIETAALNQLMTDAFTGKTTWYEASKRYPLEEFIDAFHRTRQAMQRTLEGLTDEQAAYSSELNPIWSLSETVTHLIFTQNGYHNSLVDASASSLPHLVEAAKGFGEGAKSGIKADILRDQLEKATAHITDTIQQTQRAYDPARVMNTPLFGDADYRTCIFLLCAHEVDHVRQAIMMRRLSRNFTDRNVTLPTDQR